MPYQDKDNYKTIPKNPVNFEPYGPNQFFNQEQFNIFSQLQQLAGNNQSTPDTVESTSLPDGVTNLTETQFNYIKVSNPDGNNGAISFELAGSTSGSTISLAPGESFETPQVAGVLYDLGAGAITNAGTNTVDGFFLGIKK